MQFIVKEKETGAEQGPFPEEIMIEWVDSDRIFPTSEMRNSMLPSWKKAEDFPFLKEAFQKQEARLGADNPDVNPELAEINSTGNRFLSMFGKGKKVQSEKRTSFRNAYVADPAGFFLRMKAALTDFAVLFLVAVILGGVFTGLAFRMASSTTTSDSPEVKSVREKIQSDAEAEAKKLREEAEQKKKEAEKLENMTTSERAKYEEEQKAAAAEAEKSKESKPKSVSPAGQDAVTQPEVPSVDSVESAVMPSAIDDVSKGFHVGSRWIDQDKQVIYSCISASRGYAKWINIKGLNGLFAVWMFLFVPIVILYYAVSIGLWAQTPGMWLWGIFVSRFSDLNQEAYCFRSYLFVLLSIVMCPLMPVWSFLRKRTIPEFLTDTWVIRIASKKK